MSGLQLTSRFTDALVWAGEIHAQQRRKIRQDPYLSHLLRVSGAVMEWAEDEDVVIAALLHDAAEDQGGGPMLEKIRERFGGRVAQMVEDCSDSLTPTSNSKGAWHKRKRHHIDRVGTVLPESRLIMLCDKIDNSRAVLTMYRQEGEDVFGYFRGGTDYVWYLRSMYEALKVDTPALLATELRLIVEQLEAAL